MTSTPNPRDRARRGDPIPPHSIAPMGPIETWLWGAALTAAGAVAIALIALWNARRAIVSMAAGATALAFAGLVIRWIGRP